MACATCQENAAGGGTSQIKRMRQEAALVATGSQPVSAAALSNAGAMRNRIRRENGLNVATARRRPDLIIHLAS